MGMVLLYPAHTLPIAILTLKKVGDTEVPFLKGLGIAIAGIRENP
jgi:hypothetical protein